jgi:hypothetical protein
MKNKSHGKAAVKGLQNLGKLVAGSEEAQADTDLGVNPIGAINAGEGMDMCIWKVTMDRRSRTVADISEDLVTYGFDRRVVKDRVIILTNHKNWFDRATRGGETLYTLKKNIKMPGLDRKVDDADARVPEEPDALNDFQKHIHQLESEREAQGAVEVVMTPEVVAEEVVEPEPMPSAVPDFIPTYATPPLSAAEGVKVCIWNVMSDYQPYSLGDIALLLSDIGVKYQTVASRISNLLIKENWFDVTQGKSGRLYTLRREIAKPAPGSAYSPNVDITPNYQVKEDLEQQADLELEAAIAPVEEIQPVTQAEPEVAHADDVFTDLTSRDAKKISDVSDFMHLRHSKPSNGTMADYGTRKDRDLTEHDLVNARRRREWEKETGYGKADPDAVAPGLKPFELPVSYQSDVPSCECGNTTGVHYVGVTCGACGTTVKSLESRTFPQQLVNHMATMPDWAYFPPVAARGVLADMNANRIQARNAVLNAPVRAMGETEVRIAASYSGVVPQAPAPKVEPVTPFVKEEEPMDFESSLVKFVIRIGEQELTPKDTVVVAKSLVQQGYGPERNTPLPQDTELVKFGIVIAGQSFNPEQTQEIACALVKAGFTE